MNQTVTSVYISNSRSPDILKWDKVLVHEGLIDFIQNFHAFGHFTKHSVDFIQVVQVFTRGYEELRTCMKDYTHYATHPEESFWSVSLKWFPLKNYFAFYN